MRTTKSSAAAAAGALLIATLAWTGQATAEEAKQRGPGHRAGQGAGHGAGRGAQHGRGPWRGGRGADAQFLADRELFHYLLENHKVIRRTVKKLDNGVETLTESDDPTVALAIQGHVASMKRRVEKMQPIHMRDPLFRAVFGNASRIDMKAEKTDKGIRVVETSNDPYVARLIQAHAEVVSLFVAKGHAEAHVDHAVPKPIPAGD